MAVTDRPSLIICRTHIAFGSPNKQDTAGAHGSPLGEEEVRLTKQAYGWPTEPRSMSRPRRSSTTRATIPRGEQGRAGVGRAAGGLPRRAPGAGRGARGDLRAASAHAAGGTAQAFRAGHQDGHAQASQEVLQVAAGLVPTMIGGAADLAPSTLTLLDGGGAVERDAFEDATCISAFASTRWARSSTDRA